MIGLGCVCIVSLKGEGADRKQLTLQAGTYSSYGQFACEEWCVAQAQTLVGDWSQIAELKRRLKFS